MKRIAYIPARGGSKGLPRKNIRLMCGRPLVSYTIQVAQKTNLFDYIFVSTDSEEIATVAKSYGGWVPFLRNPRKAQDETPIIEAVLDDCRRLKALGCMFDIFCLLQPTSPLRKVEDIVGAVSLCEEKKEGVVSLSPVEEHPLLMRKMDDQLRLTKLLKERTTARRQDMPKIYRVNGAVYVVPEAQLSKNTVFADLPIGYVMAAENGLDIDTLEDFNFAQAVLRREVSYDRYGL